MDKIHGGQVYRVRYQFKVEYVLLFSRNSSLG
jgi:hypothetical protein